MDQDVKDLKETIAEIIGNSPAAEHSDNAGIEEINHNLDTGDLVVKYYGHYYQIKIEELE